MDTNATPALAKINNVTKKYGKLMALDDISFELHKYQVLCILGPNGAGKTTLINVILGRLSLSSGEISVLGSHPGNLKVKQQSGVMLQVSGLPDMSLVKEQIQLFRSYYPNPMNYDEVVALSGLKECESKYCKNLSGGQKQRLLFALSICGKPKLLFLDEPSTGLDISIRKSLWECVQKLKANGTSIILTTHYLEEADYLSDRIIMLNKGKIIQQGSPDEIKSSFKNKTIRFTCAKPINEFKHILDITSINYSKGYYEIETRKSEKVIHSILNITQEISDLTISGAALEDAFLSMSSTGENYE